MRNQLETEYRGAKLQIEFDNKPQARLSINGLYRDKAVSDKDQVTLKLSSPVQTDYEWHEIVEALIEYQADAINASIFASNVLLQSTSIPR